MRRQRLFGRSRSVTQVIRDTPVVLLKLVRQVKSIRDRFKFEFSRKVRVVRPPTQRDGKDCDDEQERSDRKPRWSRHRNFSPKNFLADRLLASKGKLRNVR